MGVWEKSPPEDDSTGKSRYTIIILIVWDSRSNLRSSYYCAISANPLNQIRFLLLNEEIRRSPDPYPVNSGPSAPWKSVRSSVNRTARGDPWLWGKPKLVSMASASGTSCCTGWISASQVTAAVEPILGRMRRVYFIGRSRQRRAGSHPALPHGRQNGQQLWQVQKLAASPR